MGIQSDEATYYMMGHSLAEDGDLAYRREDLARVWREFPSGPAGVFLKKGRSVTGMDSPRGRRSSTCIRRPDPDAGRLYFGKSFIYPLVAAPFVLAFGTNGFLVLHALLLSLVILSGYLFLHARMQATVAVLLATAFVMATVVPVYFVWITPELFNFSLIVLAYTCWLFKEVADSSTVPRGARWLLSPSTDIGAAVLLGIATFSKPSNLLLYIPIALWHVWQRPMDTVASSRARLRRGDRRALCRQPGHLGRLELSGRRAQHLLRGVSVPDAEHWVRAGAPRARDEALTDILFDPQVFWINLSHNLVYYFVGRYSGLVAYFFPAVFGLASFLWRPKRPGWQYLVLGGCLLQIVFFVITLPYTWFGGGGSVGNRYFVGAYGAFLFLLPPIEQTAMGSGAMAGRGTLHRAAGAQSVRQFFRPGQYASHGPLRLLPVELTNVNDLPINTNPARVRVAFGDNPDLHDPPFQIYFLDDNAYDREPDRSFWVRGESGPSS